MESPDDNIPINSTENGMSMDATPQAPKSAPFLSAALPPIAGSGGVHSADGAPALHGARVLQPLEGAPSAGGACVGDSGDSSGANCVSVLDQDVEPMDADDLERSSSNIADVRFDVCIGHIEDIIMEDEFQTMQTAFVDQYYTEFDDSEENKFSYTDIHNQYINTVEKFLDTQLKLRIPDFNMAQFAQQLQQKHKDEVLEGEIFEILLTFTDFMAFKEMMLDHRAEKEGRSMDLSGMLTVTRKS